MRNQRFYMLSPPLTTFLGSVSGWRAALLTAILHISSQPLKPDWNKARLLVMPSPTLRSFSLVLEYNISIRTTSIKFEPQNAQASWWGRKLMGRRHINLRPTVVVLCLRGSRISDEWKSKLVWQCASALFRTSDPLNMSEEGIRKHGVLENCTAEIWGVTEVFTSDELYGYERDT